MKKALSIILAVMLLFSVIPVSAMSAENKPGDVNLDGSVTVSDALLALRSAVGKITLTGVSADMAEVNGEGGVTVADALLILRYAVGKITSFPRVYSKIETMTITDDQLYDKIAGSMIGQMVGVTWGAPTEFRYCGSIIPEEGVPEWKSETINDAFTQDDLYVEIPFMQALVDNGVNCSIDALAENFKNSKFSLAHANLQARNNLLNGISAPESGSYKNSYHADDIDWQIECDFLGNIYPGLVNQSASRAFDVGHIMNYGDGVYGGVFMTAMENAAFTATTLDEVISAGVNAIPKGTKFRSVMDDILKCYHSGGSWEDAWNTLEQTWALTDRCAECQGAMDIDAKLNSGYVLIGLLYGGGDMAETVKIAMRCGQDSDCNPSSAASVLGKFKGLSGIEDIYKQSANYNNAKFSYTNYTLQNSIDTQVALAKENMTNAGFTHADGVWKMQVQKVVSPVTYEQWPDSEITAYIDITVFNKLKIDLNLNYVSPSKPTEIQVNMGDGTVFDHLVKSYTYSNPGTYNVTLTVKSGSLEGKASKTIEVKNTMDFNYTAFVSNSNRTVEGDAGSQDIGVIADGYIPDITEPDLTYQYDTYGATVAGEVAWFGLNFEKTQNVSEVIFTEGALFPNGGWFAEVPHIEVCVNGEWVSAASEIDPLYPGTNSQSGHGDSYKTYVFSLHKVTACDGIRVCGTVGGTSNFVSCSELRVTLSEIVEYTPVVSHTDPKGGGNKSPAVINDGVFPNGSVIDGSLQYDTYGDSATNDDVWFGLTFSKSQTVYGIDFAEGIYYSNGGWFMSVPVAEVLVDGEWKPVAASVSPMYPPVNDLSGHGSPFNRYTFLFDEPTDCAGIRVRGNAGGSGMDGFASCSEIAPLIHKPNIIIYTPSASCESSAGSGNSSAAIMADGIIPSSSANGQAQFDTYGRTAPGDDVWFSLEFSAVQNIYGVNFSEGMHFANGGWFKQAPTLEIKVDGKWKSVNSSLSLEYPADTYEGHTENFTTYALLLDSPTNCSGVRVRGLAGGTSGFASCSEISVISTTLVKPIVSHNNPLGGGSRSLDVLTDEVTSTEDPGYLDQYDTYGATHAGDTAWFGLDFTYPRRISGVEFSNGNVFDDGGWFSTAPVVEVLIGGEWKTVSSTISSEYPIDGKSGAYATYTFTLDETVVCSAVRVSGTVGGSNGFASCSEITAIFG